MGKDAMKSTLTFASLLALGLMCMEAAAWTPPAALRAAAPRQRAACAQLRMTGGTSTFKKHNEDHETGNMAEMYGGFFTPKVKNVGEPLWKDVTWSHGDKPPLKGETADMHAFYNDPTEDETSE